MASFTSFYHILPDPLHPIGLAGQQDATGFQGPGFASVKLTSEEPIMIETHPSGREETASGYRHKWGVSINYNPMPCELFHVVHSFLLWRQATMEPFYVVLPQHYNQNVTNKVLGVTGAKGDDTVIITGTGVVPNTIFNFGNHYKTYMVTRVETSTDYYTPEGSPGAGERLHITPSLQEDVTAGYSLEFIAPKIIVTQANEVLSYKLNTNNLYQYSVELEETII